MGSPNKIIIKQYIDSQKPPFLFGRFYETKNYLFYNTVAVIKLINTESLATGVFFPSLQRFKNLTKPIISELKHILYSSLLQRPDM